MVESETATTNELLDDALAAADANAPSSDQNLSQSTTDIHAVVYPHDYEGKPSYARPTRDQKPGWVRPIIDKMIICYECYGRGHTRTECEYLQRERTPEADNRFRVICEKNYLHLSDKERAHLHEIGRSPFVVKTNNLRPPSVEIPEDKSKN